MDYILVARSITNGEFGIGSAKSKFLEVPPGAKVHTPAMEISRTAWIRKVIAIGETGRNAQNRPVGDVLIYIHGFNTAKSDVLKRHRLIRTGLEKLGYKGAVVSFDWPCADTALNYLPDRVVAKKTALQLVTDGIASFARTVQQDCEISTHVLAHSMGAFVLREAFDDADDRPELVAKGWSLSQVMLIGADVSASSMGASDVSSSLYRHCVRLTNYANPYDAVLSISNAKRVGVSPRVGRVGLPESAPSKAVNVDVGEYYDTHREDFANVQNSDHSFYYHSPEMMIDILHTLEGRIDRHKIPTRFVGDDGGLHLKTRKMLKAKPT
jgi:esterase/lipase superfamily enzyme